MYNAANEQAVALFLAGAIRFGDIPRAIESALDSAWEICRARRAKSCSRQMLRARRHVMELI